jgi:addiction module RelE/StbE family toxin
MKIAYHPKFIRQYNKLPEDLKIEIKEKIALFEQNPLHPSLKNHKLHGKLKAFQAFSVNYSYRILYVTKGNMAILSKIGTHDLYK